jgi:hypothetical protein
MTIQPKGNEWRVRFEGKCKENQSGHMMVTVDFIQKCAFCGYRRWLGLV